MQSSSDLFSYPNDWSEQGLEAVAEINPESLGSSTPSSFQFQYIDISSVNVGVIDWHSVTTQVFATAPSRARRIVRPGDVLLSTVRPGLQSHAFAYWGDGSDSYICSTGFAVIRAGRALEPRFLRHLVFSNIVTTQLHRLETGSNYPAVPESDVKLLHIPIPPLPEQRRIAEILDAANKAVQQTERVIAKLKVVKAGLLQDLLTHGLDEHGHLRDPQAHPEQFKDSPLGRIPREWEVTTLGNVITRSGGLIQTGPFGSQLHAEEYTTEGIPVIMPQDIQGNRISEDQIARIPLRKAKALARHRVVPNDVVFARRGDLSRCAPIGERETGWLCGTGCLLVRSPEKVIDGYWLSGIYQHDRSQRQIAARAVGSTMVNLNTSLLASLVIAKPPYDEQVSIIETLNAQDARIRAEEAELAKLRQVKRGLMDDLLTGRVRVDI
jgi:type I restriction enzyme S subunit